MASVSLLALLAAHPASAAPPLRSLQQALNARVAAAALPSSRSAAAASVGVANLQAAASRLLSLSQALAVASGGTAAAAVPNGLMIGGLQPAQGFTTSGNANAWQGLSATQPIAQATAGGVTTVTITQAKPQAVLNWQTFNVGSHTVVNFNQSAGGAAAPTWSVLNRIDDPSLSPTEIFGAIKAQGQVLVLNRNGVLFEPGAQVSLHSLIAGAAAMTDSQYLNNGIYSTDNTTPSFTAGPGAVSVAAGADIVTTEAPSVTTGGGNVILLGSEASNAGMINTPGGQTILAAGRSFTLLPGYSVTQTTAATSSSDITVLGSQIATTGPGTVTNTGLIESTDGDITLDGQIVQQAGVLLASSSVNQRGTIHLLNNLVSTSNGNTATNANGQITLAPGSVTEILPDASAATALNSAQTAADTPETAYGGGASLNDEAPLPDRPGLSRVEITTGGTITYAANSLVLAPGGQIAADATGRIFAASGASLDVSGLNGVTMPIAENLLAISVEPFNLRDSPLNNSATGPLNSTTAYVDARDVTAVSASAADTSVRDYTSGGLLEVSGALGDVGHTADEWATVAGQIMLYAAQVIAQQGSTFNIAGGSETFSGGAMRQSYVETSTGAIYNVDTAPNTLQYVGLYDGFTVGQPRWHTSQTYVNALLTPATLDEPGYTIGRNAGTLVLSTPTSVFAGTVNGGVQQGITQIEAQPAGTTDGFTVAQTQAPLAGMLDLGNFTPNQSVVQNFPTAVIIDTAGSAAFAASLTNNAALPASLANTAAFANAQLNGLGAVSISVAEDSAFRGPTASIAVQAPITLAPGGQITLTAPMIDVTASILAPAGAITLQTLDSATSGPTVTSPVTASAIHDIVSVAQGVTLSAAGIFTNVALDPGTAALAAYQNGGTVTVESYAALSLQAGSAIDTSAGAVLTPKGFSGGAGGSVTIIADDPNAAITVDSHGAVQLDAAITSYGVTTSGTLAITVPSVLIANTKLPVASREIELSPGIFTHGFTDYVIDGYAVPTYTSADSGVTVAAGTQIVANVPVLVEGPQTNSLPTQTPGGGMQLLLPPAYSFNASNDTVTQRIGASLTLTSGTVGDPQGNGELAPSPPAFATPELGAPVTLQAGASISVDQGQNVTLSSLGQVTVEGTITAHAGTISLLNLTRLGSGYLTADSVSGLSVWVGPNAELDASAVAETTLDAQGNPYGVVPAGGSIILGSIGDFADFGNGSYGNADAAFLFVRPGAVLDASGTSAAIAVTNAASVSGSGSVTSQVVQDATKGGTITAVSGQGIYLDGSLSAKAGGPAAEGGVLQIELDTPQYAPATATTADPVWTIDPHEIVVSRQITPTPLPENLVAGSNAFLNNLTVAGQAAISQAQIDAGGFTNIDLFSRDQIAFNGTVDLSAAQSIELVAYSITDTSLRGSVTIAAPFVLLAGAPPVAGVGPSSDYGITPLLNKTTAPLPVSEKYQPCISGAGNCTQATLSVAADQIDIESSLGFGVHGVVTDGNQPFGGASVTATIDAAGFNAVDLVSAGAIVMAASNSATSSSSGSNALGLTDQAAELETAGNLSLSSAELYPQTGVAGTLLAGQSYQGTLYNHGVLDIGQPEGASPTAPLSAFGSLTLESATVNQGGVLYAPLGGIDFTATTVNLLRGSNTSVSAEGLSIPFGGTTDGVNYTYAGSTLTALNPAAYGVLNSGLHNQSIAFNAAFVVGSAGSTLNVSGGGTLSGGGGEVSTGGSWSSQGFISGSGGSTDVLYSTIVSFNSAAHSVSQSVASTNPAAGAGIYAILPTAGIAYAPGALLDAQADYAGSVPLAGEQITVGAGVPGLKPGAYTLLPAYYALLPGAYRVQIAQGTTTSTVAQSSTQDGISYETTGTLGFVNTAVSASLPTAIVVTPAAGVLRYSQYDTEDFASYAVSQAAVFDTPRPYLPQDAGVITFNFNTPANLIDAATAPTLALRFSGTADLLSAAGGYDGTVAIEVASGEDTLAILGAGEKAPAGAIAVPAASIDALQAPLLLIGGDFRQFITSANGPNPEIEYASSTAGSIEIMPQATLTAGAVWLFAGGSINVSAGADISTLGRSISLPDSSTGVLFVGGSQALDNALNDSPGSAVVAVANGTYDFIPATGAGGSGNVTIGGSAPGLNPPAQLSSAGLVAIGAGGSLDIASNTAIAAADFSVTAPEINIGAAPPGAVAPAGYTITPTILKTLLAGNAATGAPAATSIDLTATDSLNLFGAVGFDAPALSLVLTTPAIYGYGSAGQDASISVGTLTWNGSLSAPGPVIARGPGSGSGTLTLQAQQIVLGYPAQSEPEDQTTLARLIAGFSTVNLAASDYISANNTMSLAVYQTQGAYVPGSGYGFAGGALNISTPLLTTAPGAILSITAGGPVTLAPSSLVGTAASVPSGLGGEIRISGASISDSTSIVLPGGALDLTATGNIALAPGASIDLGGRAVGFFDITQDSFAGTLTAESAAGNITQAAGSRINIAATGADAGAIELTASSGTVSLAGTITGSADSGFNAGSIGIRAGTIAGLTALDQMLDSGGVFYARSFEQTGPGDITVGSELQAQTISVSVDHGSLTVDGTLDASGAAPGTISLAAATGVVITSAAVLDAHGSVLQTDSTGAPIAAENAPQVNLTVSAGTLTIDPGATIDLASPDGVSRGDLEINVPRTGATSGNAEISASGSIGITGAGTIAVNAFWTYSPDSSPSSLAGGTITQASLAAFNADSQTFIANARAGMLANGQLAGLLAHADAFHLRPGVQIESSADVAGGALTISGDLDLAFYRYSSVNPDSQLTSTAGSGEPGVLWIRAACNVNVYGSVTDGFAAPPATPDDDGWVLTAGTSDTVQPIVLPVPVGLAGAGGGSKATTYPVANYTLSYPVVVQNGASLAAGHAVPSAAVVSSAVTLTSAFVLDGTITLAGGTTYTPGQTVPAGTMLPAGTALAAGTILPVTVKIGGPTGASGLSVPAGTDFDIFSGTSVTLEGTLSLAAGDVIPQGASIQFSNGASTFDTRPLSVTDANGAAVQGQLLGVAPLLPAGDLSWSMSFVSGANLAAADSQAVLPQTTLQAGAAPGTTPGSLVLSDPHYAETSGGAVGADVDFSVVRTGTGSLNILSGGSITEASLYGVYTAGTQSADVTAAYNQPLPSSGSSVLGSAGDLPGPNGATYNAALTAYQANYPAGGGNLLVSAQANIVGDTYQPAVGFFSPAAAGTVNISLESDATSQWLWWQGSTGIPSAWWINYGTFIASPTLSNGTPGVVYMTGFTGFGTLGGGNVTLAAGGTIGTTTTSILTSTTTAVSATVASTGRTNSTTGATELTGGGRLTLAAGGAINPVNPGGDSDDFAGTIADLRGNITVAAGSIGAISQAYIIPSNAIDPRANNPFASETFDATGGLVVSLGDASATLDVRGSEVLAGVGTPTLGSQAQQADGDGQPISAFSLWQPTTSVTLNALGGDIVPVSTSGSVSANESQAGTLGFLYPPNLAVTAFSGSVEFDAATFGSNALLELAPSPTGQLQVLAGTSIIDTVVNPVGGLGEQTAIDISGASTASGDIPTPANPASTPAGYFTLETGVSDSDTGVEHVGDLLPSVFYAVSGDVLGLYVGQLNGSNGQLENTFGYSAKAVDVRAGRDIVNLNAAVLDNNATDISTIQAGRDVIYATEQIAGPGELDVQAGRNVYQGYQGTLTSVGEIAQALTVATRDDGAAITVLAGVGADGPDLTGFADLYLNPANLADPNTPLQDQTGKVERSYQAQLLAWLQQRYGYAGTAADALATFLALPTDQQTEFLLTVYFDELNQSGLDYTNPSSRFYHSYLEGNDAIKSLFPATDLTGKSPADGGSLTLFSGGKPEPATIRNPTTGQTEPNPLAGQAEENGSIRTLFGGSITTVVPFGQTSLGNYGVIPGATAGITTSGTGSIDMYSYGSVTLGQSRVLTTFGGNILIWMSSDGEINAGRGSKSTVLTAPIGISYDDYGNITLSSTVPSTGAGIGTISPIPEVPAGDINLIAPVGTIDAGEAGIRSSGNANLAALTLLNANNIQVGGKTTGVPTVTAPSTAAQAASSAAAGAAAQANQDISRPPPAQLASVIDVDVSVGDGGSDDEDRRKRRRAEHK
jgi:filamentous hemagglutinin family protein